MNRFTSAPTDAEAVTRLRVGWLIDGSGRPARINVLLTIAGGALRPSKISRPLPPFPLTASTTAHALCCRG